MAIPLPGPDQLPDGPLRTFVVALHGLYDQAGQPAARLVSNDIFALPRHLESVSHQTVSATLRGISVPAWGKVKSIVVALARRGEVDVDDKTLDRRFKPLWLAARSTGRIRTDPEFADPPGAFDRVPFDPPRRVPEIRDPPPPTPPRMQPGRSSSAIRPGQALRSRIEPPTAVSLEPTIGGLPDRDHAFTGREALLDQMRAELLEHPHTPLVLHGLGGVGKSQLAREYVERHRQSHRITWWVQAEWTEQVRTSIVDLAGRLDVRMGQGNEQTIDAVIGQLESQPTPYLLVFDGVVDNEVRPLMPTFGGHVIVTTRDPAWGHDSTSTGIEVPDFTIEEAVAFLCRQDSELTVEYAEELVRRIGRLPLALAHIAAVRGATGQPWEVLLRRLEDHTVNPPPGQPSPYPPEVFASIEVAVNAFAAANPVAMLVLELFAWFGSEPVSIALLRQGRAGEVTPALRRALISPVELAKALAAIQQFGLARLYADQRVEVQPVTRRALRDVLSAEALERGRHNAHEILAAADQGQPDDLGATGMHREIGAHVLPVGLIGTRSEASLSTVYNHVRHRYIIGDYSGARALAERAIAAWKADPALGPAHEQVLLTTHELANALRALGQYQEARDLTADAMSRLRAEPAYGDDHWLTLYVSSSHASDLRIAGDYRRALEIDRDTLDRCTRTLGGSDPQTATRWHNLAVSLRHVGDFTTAEGADRQTLDLHLDRHGPNDWRTMLSVNALAEDLFGLGRYPQVLALVAEHAGRRLPGRLDRGALLMRRTVALAHRGLGAVGEALDLLDEHYRECTQAFGPDHEYTLAAQVSYANTLRLCGAVPEAYSYASDAVLAYVRTFGRRNPLTLAAEINLATILRALRDRIRAQQTDAVASEVLRDTLGERHPFTIAATANLATDYALTGRHASAARTLSERAYAAACEVRGADHPDTLAIAANLVLDLAGAGEFTASKALRDTLLVALHRTLGADHPMAADIALGRRTELAVEPPSA